jgi:hypothetical protein
MSVNCRRKRRILNARLGSQLRPRFEEDKPRLMRLITSGGANEWVLREERRAGIKRTQ